MGVGTVTVVIAGAAAAAADESSSAFSSSIRGTAGASDERSFRIFLSMESQHESAVNPSCLRAVSLQEHSGRRQHRRQKHNNYLYEGRRDRISLRFWESDTLSTDSCESSLSATVEIWENNNNNQLCRTHNTSGSFSLKQPLSSGQGWILQCSCVCLCLLPAQPGPVGTG